MIDVVELLRTLISIPSVNPMGGEVPGSIHFEHRVSDELEQRLRAAGAIYERVEVAPGRANLLARYTSPGARRTVLLDAHQDTVPVAGMTIDPFDPVVRDGRIYGRGACDVKGGAACMLAAFLRLLENRPAGAANVVLALTCDEEATSLGVHHLLEFWRGSHTAYQLLSPRPDFAIVAEPTLLNLVVAHRGVERLRLTTHGVACHSSRPQDGVNAIYRMARIVSLLEEFARWLPGSRPPHPLCGPASLSVGVIQGGTAPNVVPDTCWIDVDRRLLPGEDRVGVVQELVDYLQSRVDFPFETAPPSGGCDALSDEDNAALANGLQQVVAARVGPREQLGAPYGTHASRFALAGIPSVVCGPGDIAQAHTKDEWIAIDELAPAVDIYYQSCLSANHW